MKITLQPKVLQWARERISISRDEFAEKMAADTEKIAKWEKDGEIHFGTAEKLAKVTHTPFGQLFLGEPPEDKLPIADFRTLDNLQLLRPTPDLLETVYTMQRRQAWLRDFLIEEGHLPVPFTGNHSITGPIQEEVVAAAMRATLELRDDWAAQQQNWSQALGHLRKRVETAGIMVVINGVVGNSTKRKLDPDEFRGFALCDDYAPLIFINGADFKAAQMFTLAHELAHLWFKQEGISNLAGLLPSHESQIEQRCDQVAAEFLLPAKALKKHWPEVSQVPDPFSLLARRFKVSELVVARRAFDLGYIDHDEFFKFYNSGKKANMRDQPKKTTKTGGDFWNTQNVRIGKHFGFAVVRAAREGKLLYRDAYRLTGLHGTSFETFATKTLGLEG